MADGGRRGARTAGDDRSPLALALTLTLALTLALTTTPTPTPTTLPTPTPNDGSGAGVVMRRASATELVQNQIELNAGAGVFADSLSEGQLSRNVLKGSPNNKT